VAAVWAGVAFVVSFFVVELGFFVLRPAVAFAALSPSASATFAIVVFGVLVAIILRLLLTIN